MSDSIRRENPGGGQTAPGELSAELAALESRLCAVEDAVRALRAQWTRMLALTQPSQNLPPRPTTGATGRDDEEARRYARILVSEIELYYPEEVARGAIEKNLYARLKEPIHRSRRAYEQRYGKPAVGGADYFQEEMVRRLAKGDPALLGPPDNA